MSSISVSPRSCASGRHRAAAARTSTTPGIDRSRCLDCGQPLVRSLATRRWIVSAFLG